MHQPCRRLLACLRTRSRRPVSLTWAEVQAARAAARARRRARRSASRGSASPNMMHTSSSSSSSSLEPPSGSSSAASGQQPPPRSRGAGASASRGASRAAWGCLPKAPFSASAFFISCPTPSRPTLQQSCSTVGSQQPATSTPDARLHRCRRCRSAESTCSGSCRICHSRASTPAQPRPLQQSHPRSPSPSQPPACPTSHRPPHRERQRKQRREMHQPSTPLQARFAVPVEVAAPACACSSPTAAAPDPAAHPIRPCVLQTREWWDACSTAGGAQGAAVCCAATAALAGSLWYCVRPEPSLLTAIRRRCSSLHSRRACRCLWATAQHVKGRRRE